MIEETQAGLHEEFYPRQSQVAERRYWPVMKYIIGGLLTLVFLSLGFSAVEATDAPMAQLCLSEKKAIAAYAFAVMDAFAHGSEIPAAPPAEKINAHFQYDNVFVSLYRKNALLACWGFKEEGGVFADIRKAVLQCVQDKRADIIFNNTVADDVYIVISFLYNKIDLEQSDPEYLKNNIELGVHSLSVHKENSEAYFISSIPVTYSYGITATLKRLCAQAGMEKDCYAECGARLSRYDTEVFKADGKNNITDLYRFNIYVDVNDITQKRVYASISFLKDWFLNNVDPATNLLEYEYYPYKDEYAEDDNNHTRQLATLWALTELRAFLKTEALDGLIRQTTDYYVSRERVDGGHSYVAAEKDPQIGLNAFLIMALLNIELPGKEQVLKRLAQGIVFMQQADGSYRTNFISQGISAKDYLPGESMLALMKLYAVTKDRVYLDSVRKAFFYYREYWRGNKNTAFIPWHTQVYYLLYRETKQKEVADFVFEMNDWLIDNYQVFDSPYIDEIGGYPRENPGGCTTAVYLEGINNAYALARERGDVQHEKKYARSIELGTRFLLQAQFNEENSFYLADPKKAIGGIRRTLTDNSQRVDYVQHSVMAMLKTYRNKIFE